MSIWHLQDLILKKVSDIVIDGQRPLYVYLNNQIVWKRSRDLLFKGNFTLSMLYVNYHLTNQWIEKYKPDIRYTLFWLGTGMLIANGKLLGKIQVQLRQVLRIWNLSTYLSISELTYTKFNILGLCYALGSLENMINGYEYSIPEYSFYRLFESCPIHTAPAIVFDLDVLLGQSALAYIFKDCINLYLLTINIKQKIDQEFLDDTIMPPMPGDIVLRYVNAIDTVNITRGISWMQGTGGSINRPKVYKQVKLGESPSYLLDRPRPVIHTNMLTSMYWIDPIWKTVGSKGFSEHHGYFKFVLPGFPDLYQNVEDITISSNSLKVKLEVVDNKLKVSVVELAHRGTINVYTKQLGGDLAQYNTIDGPIFKDLLNLTFKLEEGHHGSDQGIMSPALRYSSLSPSKNATTNLEPEENSLDIFRYIEMTPLTPLALTNVIFKCSLLFSDAVMDLLGYHDLLYFRGVTACYKIGAIGHDYSIGRITLFPFRTDSFYNINPEVIYYLEDQSPRLWLQLRAYILTKDGYYLDDGPIRDFYILPYKGLGSPDSSRYVYYVPDPLLVLVLSIKVNGKLYNNVMVLYYAPYPSYVLLRASIARGDEVGLDSDGISLHKLKCFDTHVDPNDVHIPDVYFTATLPLLAYTPLGDLIYE